MNCAVLSQTQKTTYVFYNTIQMTLKVKLYIQRTDKWWPESGEESDFKEA